jgi:C4-dicarboxylate-specific signal transduction histidine kinase
MSTTEDWEAEFIGKITAATTHELRNVLAIVKESAGLISDILNPSNQPGPPQSEKLMRVTGRIDAQVKRGSELLTSLNRFAHSLDHAEDEIDLDDAAQLVPFLCQRAAKKGRYQIEAQAGEQRLTIVLNLLRLQMALHAAVECCLEQLPEGGTLKLRPVRHEQRPSLEFNGEAGGQVVSLDPTEATASNRLATVLEGLSASIERVESAQGFRLVFSG